MQEHHLPDGDPRLPPHLVALKSQVDALMNQLGTDEERRQVIAALQVDAPPGLKAFLTQYDTHEAAKDACCLIKARLEIDAAIANLAIKAREGKLYALGALAYMASRSTKQLETFAAEDPNWVRLEAEHCEEWAVTVKYPKSPKDRHHKYLTKIGLGSALVTTPPRQTRSDESPAYCWAVRLLKTVQAFRSMQTLAVNGLTRIVVMDLDELGGIAQPSEHPNIYEMAGRLPEFTRSTAAKWWTVALKLFMELTNDKPWELAELANYANTKRVKTNFFDRKADGVKRAEVEKAVRQAFIRIARQSCLRGPSSAMPVD